MIVILIKNHQITTETVIRRTYRDIRIDEHKSKLHMSQDSRYRNPRPELVDSFDEFLVNTTLPDDDIHLPPELQPLNPEYEDEVPNQEAVNSIARATRPKEPAWRDLNLRDLVNRTDQVSTQAMDVGDRLKQLNLENRSLGPPTNALRSLR